jgi:site-specific DNA-methyltransferase (adenine-specific)
MKTIKIPIYGSLFEISQDDDGKYLIPNELRDLSPLGTALKPAHEPICVARKPLAKGLTVASNVLAHGTGGLNIDGCRVGTGEDKISGGCAGTNKLHGGGIKERVQVDTSIGRWPANLIHDGSDEVLALFPETAPSPKSYVRNSDSGSTGMSSLSGVGEKAGKLSLNFGDSGSAARFFYCAKTSKKDRNEGCESLPQKAGGMVSNTSGQHITRRDEGYEPKPQGNNHPTVKPTDLMRYLCRLVTPPGGVVLDPFMGSGSTGKAAILEGFRFTGIEMNEEYMAIAAARISTAFESTIADMI